MANPEGTSRVEARKIAGSLPGLVWFSSNAHGSEPSPSEVALRHLHWLVTADNDTAQLIRKNVVVAIDPCLNPDGRGPYVSWFRSVVRSRPNPDPNSVEHSEPWPGGRFNHYYFDLSRDCVWQPQRESEQRVSVFLAYRLQVHVDSHEMGCNGSYFFPAGEHLELGENSSGEEMQHFSMPTVGNITLTKTLIFSTPATGILTPVFREQLA